jgi:hypothetical protein
MACFFHLCAAGFKGREMQDRAAKEFAEAICRQEEI